MRARLYAGGQLLALVDVDESKLGKRLALADRVSLVFERGDEERNPGFALLLEGRLEALRGD